MRRGFSSARMEKLGKRSPALQSHEGVQIMDEVINREKLIEQCNINARWLRQLNHPEEAQCWDDFAYALAGGLSRPTSPKSVSSIKDQSHGG